MTKGDRKYLIGKSSGVFPLNIFLIGGNLTATLLLRSRVRATRKTTALSSATCWTGVELQGAIE